MWSISGPGPSPTDPPLRRGAGAAAAFVRVAEAVVADVRRGALRPGDRLPSTRALARRFEVSRNTIVAAYDELATQGWIVARGAAGTFVSGDLPDPAPRRGARAPAGVASRPGFALPEPPASPPAPLDAMTARYRLSLGVPDPRLFPTAALARAYRRALAAAPRRGALEYGPAHGAPALREAIAAMVRDTRAIPATAEHVLVTRGSQQALDLIARLIVGPGRTGRVVAVEELGYAPAWAALRHAGARLVAAPLDDAGLVADALPARLAAVYTTPHHQYPTTVVMSPARRLALLGRARADGLAIIEDDYDHEYHYDGRPVAPLAAADPGGHVLHVGTLSKVLAPGLRLGYVVAPTPVIDALARLRATVDRQGDHVLELAVAELIEDGELARHARRTRGVYLGRRDALLDALDRELRGVVEARAPAGGMTLWARVVDDVALPAWQARARARGVAIAIGRDLHLLGRARPYVRLGFARHDEAELRDAVRALRRALRG